MNVTLLPSRDQAFLEASGRYQLDEDGGMISVTFERFALVAGLCPATTDLLVRLPPGYPDVGPDMFWFSELVTRVDGAVIPAAEVVETYNNRQWHRWSRHIGAQWRPGIDDLRSYVAYIRKCLVESAT